MTEQFGPIWCVWQNYWSPFGALNGLNCHTRSGVSKTLLGLALGLYGASPFVAERPKFIGVETADELRPGVPAGLPVSNAVRDTLSDRHPAARPPVQWTLG